nr:uncharacterized protein LOC108177747 isoform X1 [Oryctolagus cuniculus]
MAPSSWNPSQRPPCVPAAPPSPARRRGVTCSLDLLGEDAIPCRGSPSAAQLTVVIVHGSFLAWVSPHTHWIPHAHPGGPRGLPISQDLVQPRAAVPESAALTASRPPSSGLWDIPCWDEVPVALLSHTPAPMVISLHLQQLRMVVSFLCQLGQAVAPGEFNQTLTWVQLCLVGGVSIYSHGLGVKEGVPYNTGGLHPSSERTTEVSLGKGYVHLGLQGSRLAWPPPDPTLGPASPQSQRPVVCNVLPISSFWLSLARSPQGSRDGTGGAGLCSTVLFRLSSRSADGFSVPISRRWGHIFLFPRSPFYQQVPGEATDARRGGAGCECFFGSVLAGCCESQRRKQSASILP